jgi:Family of unknown function (DUF6325)
MVDEHDELGPIDYLIIEFPGNRLTGEGLPILVDLVDRGIIRILDLVFVRKEEDGATAMLAVSDLDGDGTFDLTVFEGAASGILGHNDVEEAGAVLRNGSSAAILIYANLWAAPMSAALRREGAQLVASGRIPLTDFVSTLGSDLPA